MGKVYRERNRLVAALSRLYPSHLYLDPSIYKPNRHLWPVVTIQTPAGQITWHLSAKDVDLFTHLQYGEVNWDGHDTEEKYRRLGELGKKDGGDSGTVLPDSGH
jgi:hypothetical protein